MSVTPSSPVVGIFTDQAMAEQAVGALYNAGFAHEQIRYSVPGTSGGFFDELKSLFTGTSAEGSNLANDLTGMGLSSEEARYYANSYTNGNVILAVQAPGREQEALSILRQYGAHNSQGAINQTMDYVDHPSDAAHAESYGTPQVQDNAQNWQAYPQPQTSVEQAFADHQQDAGTSEHDAAYQGAHPVASGYDTGTYHTQEDQVSLEDKTEKRIPLAGAYTPDYTTQDHTAQADAPEHEAGYQAHHMDTVTPEYATEDPTAQADVAVPEHEADYQAHHVDTDTPEHEVDYQAHQADTLVPEHSTEDQTTQPDVLAPKHEADYQVHQVDTATPEYATEDQTAQADVTAPEHETAYQAPQVSMVSTEEETASQNAPSFGTGSDVASQAAPADVVAPEHEDTYWSAPSDASASETDPAYQPSQASVVAPDDVAEDQAAQADGPTLEHEADIATNVDTPRPETEVPASQSAAVSTMPAEELAQLREQLQAIQQQLQDAKMQLQAEKERETHLQATKELETARQQLQEMQAELQATLAELEETRSRLSQYQ